MRIEEPATGRARIELTLGAIEPAVDRIVITGSVDTGAFPDVPDLQLTVRDPERAPITVELSGLEPVSAIVFGEFYRRGGGWKFRNVAQGWSSGLRGLAEEFGVSVDDDPVPAAAAETPSAAPAHRAGAPAARPADWYADATDPALLRWWDGERWSGDTSPVVPAASGLCGRCGRPLRTHHFGGVAPCRWCETDVHGFLRSWHDQAWQVLTTDGPQGHAWEGLWTALRYQRIDLTTGRAVMRPLAVAFLERVVAFAFADDEIEQDELDNFHRFSSILQAAADLGPAAAHIMKLRERMERGRALTRVRGGDLPRESRSNLHLEPDEILYLDVEATQIKYLASGPRRTPGRLIGSSKKLRFVGAGTGAELQWAKVVSVACEYETVVVSATTARGGGSYGVRDAEYVAAVLEGALRVAKRLVLAPGQRDTRSIPQHVKAEVWQRDGGRCCQCEDAHYLEFDHIIPISQGGATSAANLQILCRRCNLEKGARI